MIPVPLWLRAKLAREADAKKPRGDNTDRQLHKWTDPGVCVRCGLVRVKSDSSWTYVFADGSQVKSRRTPACVR